MLKSETIGDKELQKQRVRERYNERADPDKMFVIPATEQPINIYEDDQQRRVAVYGYAEHQPETSPAFRWPHRPQGSDEDHQGRGERTCLCTGVFAGTVLLIR